MIRAAAALFRARGYHGTSLNDVVDRGQAPRGSLYHNFPGGKEELAAEVVLAVTAAMIDDLNRAGPTGDSPEEVIEAAAHHFQRILTGSEFTEGCAVMSIALEAGATSPRLREATRRAFSDWRSTMAARLHDCGLPADQARAIATLAASAIEGAVVLGRLDRDTAALDLVVEELKTLTRDRISGAQR
jgi:TetR/AcrR family transcriptional repressor of lmrAB and yxaGH operons